MHNEMNNNNRYPKNKSELNQLLNEIDEFFQFRPKIKLNLNDVNVDNVERKINNNDDLNKLFEKINKELFNNFNLIKNDKIDKNSINIKTKNELNFIYNQINEDLFNYKFKLKFKLGNLNENDKLLPATLFNKKSNVLNNSNVLNDSNVLMKESIVSSKISINHKSPPSSIINVIQKRRNNSYNNNIDDDLCSKNETFKLSINQYDDNDGDELLMKNTTTTTINKIKRKRKIVNTIDDGIKNEKRLKTLSTKLRTTRNKSQSKSSTNRSQSISKPSPNQSQSISKPSTNKSQSIDSSSSLSISSNDISQKYLFIQEYLSNINKQQQLLKQQQQNYKKVKRKYQRKNKIQKNEIIDSGYSSSSSSTTSISATTKKSKKASSQYLDSIPSPSSPSSSSISTSSIKSKIYFKDQYKKFIEKQSSKRSQSGQKKNLKNNDNEKIIEWQLKTLMGNETPPLQLNEVNFDDITNVDVEDNFNGQQEEDEFDIWLRELV